MIFESAPRRTVAQTCSGLGRIIGASGYGLLRAIPGFSSRTAGPFLRWRGVRGGRTTGLGWASNQRSRSATQALLPISRGLDPDTRDGAPGVSIRAEEHHWIEEGSATYVEPIARARTGDLTRKKSVGDLIEGSHKDCRERAIAASISRRHGAEPIGVGRSFVCWPISKFASALETRRASRTRFAPFSKPAAQLNRIGRSCGALEIGDRATGGRSLARALRQDESRSRAGRSERALERTRRAAQRQPEHPIQRKRTSCSYSPRYNRAFHIFICCRLSDLVP